MNWQSIKNYFKTSDDSNFSDCPVAYFEEEPKAAATIYTKINAFYGPEELAEVFLKYLEKNGHEKTKRWLAASHWTPFELSEFVQEHGTATEANEAFRFYMKCRFESEDDK